MGQLQDIAARLVIPGLPDWTGLVALLLLLLVALAYLLMPFAVFGVKGRLEVIEAQLDELQAEIRALSLRLADAAPRRMAAEDWEDAPPAYARRGGAVQEGAPVVQPRSRPPVPPRPPGPRMGGAHGPSRGWTGPARAAAAAADRRAASRAPRALPKRPRRGLMARAGKEVRACASA